MAIRLTPKPDGNNRAQLAKRVRDKATEISMNRATVLAQENNGEADAAANAETIEVSAVGTFTKGLSHNEYGQVKTADLIAFIKALNQEHANVAQTAHTPLPGVYKGNGAGKAARFDAPLHAGGFRRPDQSPPDARGWESPISGHTFDLQATDADAVGMPPAPVVGSAELSAEMAEVYAAALIRDRPFTSWDEDDVARITGLLSKLSYFKSEDGLDDEAIKRRRARLDKDGNFSHELLFRGSTPGAKKGPYISQFLLMGNAQRKGDGDGSKGLGTSDAQSRNQEFMLRELTAGSEDPNGAQAGQILYGPQSIPQKFRVHKEGVDHMTDWSMWLDVQNGANRKDDFDRYEDDARFIATPRDLATYVHFDALYQAYLNATLILLGMKADTDIGLPEGRGNATRDAFALFGGPHILTLVTEVATRALKAVRRQKFNVHLRSRPEALAAALSLSWKGGNAAASLGGFEGPCADMEKELKPIMEQIQGHNKGMNTRVWKDVFGEIDHGPLDEDHNGLLPMAFPEGSPMHASYGAGHATVAGACVTVVKAFFEMFDPTGVTRAELPLYDIVDQKNGYPALTFPDHLFKGERQLTGTADMPCPFVADENKGFQFLRTTDCEPLTIMGELDKLAANISIGRNFAGVHFYTDYYESLRMGERIAVSMLQEHMLTYREPVSMRFKSFDEDYIMIAGTGGSKGDNDALVYVWDESGQGGARDDFEHWWNKHR